MSVNIGSTAQEILNEINNKINKTTYEASAELACSSNGKVCLGKFGAYDTNITIELNSTTSTTYHATIVIHSQNVVANGTGGSVGCNVYGDADNHITPLISVFRPYGSASRQIEVYADLPGYSKNLVHIQGVAISTGGMTDVLTSVSSIPTAIDGKIKVTPINVLKSMFASKDVATTSTAGLMSAADKVKLDNVLTLSSVREDSSGNVVVANDLKVQGGADFTNDVTVGSLTVDAGLQMNDDVEINYQYGIRWTDDNDSGLVSISRNETTGKLEVHYANNSLPSGALATIGADQIKGIYLTGENRTIVGAESDVGIIWEGDGTLFKDENAVTEITNTHFMTRVPIVAGNNVTFETDTENQVVKINATGGGGGTSGGTPTKIENGDGYVKVNEGGSIYLSTPSTGSDEMIGMEAEVVEINAPKSNSYIDIYAQNGSMTLNASNIDIMGGDVYIGKYAIEDGDPVDNFYVRSNGAVALEGFGDVLLEQGGSGSKLFMDSHGDVILDGDASLTLHKGDDDSGIDLVMSNEGTTINNPNGIHLIGDGDASVKINEDGSIYVTTPTTGSDEMIQMKAEIVEIYAESNDGVYIRSPKFVVKDKNGEEQLALGNTIAKIKLDQIVAPAFSEAQEYSSGKEGQVLMSNGYLAYWGDVSGDTGESSIIDLGVQDNHKAAQQAIVDYVISQSAENDCYLFKYWCSCYGNACFAVVKKATTDHVWVKGTVYDSESSFRVFIYYNGNYAEDGCWHNITSWDEELADLTTEEKTLLGAINELNAKVGSSSGGGSPLYLHEYRLMGIHPRAGEISVYIKGLSTSAEAVGQTISELGAAFYNKEIFYIEGSGYNEDSDEKYLLAGLEASRDYGFSGYLVPIIYNPDGERLSLMAGNSEMWLTSISYTDISQITEGVGGSSGGGATLSMPRIRFANYRYNEDVYQDIESGEFTGKITFSVHIQDGTVQEGDQLQVCKMGKTFGKNKLRAILSRTITAEDIENLAKQPYLQITTDDCSGNAIGADSYKVFKRLGHTDTSDNSLHRKPKYIRIRRPIYEGDVVVNAFFSNVEPVDMRLKYEFIEP